MDCGAQAPMTARGHAPTASHFCTAPPLETAAMNGGISVNIAPATLTDTGNNNFAGAKLFLPVLLAFLHIFYVQPVLSEPFVTYLSGMTFFPV